MILSVEEKKGRYTEHKHMKQGIKDIVHLGTVPAIIASLCCLSPVILLSLGVVSLSAAGELADMLYGEYKWLFRAAGLIALAVFIASYLKKKKNICTLDEVKRRRNEVINTAALALIAGTIFYVIFLYGIVEVIGKALRIW